MFVDSHTHLLRLEVSPEEAVEAASAEGVEAVVNIGTTIEDSRKGSELAAALPNVYTAVGIHPHNAGDYTPGDLEALAEISESPGVVALGEVGLAGDLRRVPGVERRLAEAARLGFELALVPTGSRDVTVKVPRLGGLRVVEVPTLADALTEVALGNAG